MHKLVVTNVEGATRAIARGLDRALASKLKVLWLFSGGSNIAIEIDVLRLLEHATPQNLVVSMIDERFVPLDSPNSNWHALVDAGLNGQKATLEPPILDWNLNLHDAAADWAKRLKKVMGEADAVVGQLGIGPDGHTAGILPHTAGTHEEEKLVIGYKGHDFERLTVTPAVLRDLDLAVAVAMGEAKKPILERMPTDIAATEQPAQLLLLAKELIVYTDQEVRWT
jgi:6-phosphogluconolactonase/glucosamine-6-phosphate isomerase/deaminase